MRFVAGDPFERPDECGDLVNTTPPVYRSGAWRVLDFQVFAAGPHCLSPEGASLGCRERLKIKPRQAQYTKWRSSVNPGAVENTTSPATATLTSPIVAKISRTSATSI